MKIDRQMLIRMHRSALSNYKDKAKNPHESGDEFLARCWVQAFTDVLKGEGYDLAAIIDSRDIELLDGMERISFEKPGV